MRPLSLDELLALRDEGTQILDTRRAEQFEAAHLAGSLNVGLEGRYATWCGTLLDAEQPVALIADPGREEEATMRLGRIGFDHVAGHVEGGMGALAERPDLVAKVERLAPAALAERLADGDPPLPVDVRTEREYEAGDGIEGAVNMPLAKLPDRVGELPRDRGLVAYCASGYRAAIAASVLQAASFERVADLAGGLGAWEAAR